MISDIDTEGDQTTGSPVSRATSLGGIVDIGYAESVSDQGYSC